MNISTKREYIHTLRLRYQSTTFRKEKTAILSEVVANLHIARKSAIRALNRKTITYTKKHVGKKEIYGFDLLAPLRIVWQTVGCPCSKRLHPQIGNIIDKLKDCHEIRLQSEQEKLLRQMKFSTIDKLLESERDISKKEYGLSGTKRSPLLKTLIPIRTNFSAEETKEPGHVEMDCVLHCGESLKGHYAETLNVLDISSHWNEKRIFLNKTKAKIVGAFHDMRTKQFPFPFYQWTLIMDLNL